MTQWIEKFEHTTAMPWVAIIYLLFSSSYNVNVACLLYPLKYKQFVKYSTKHKCTFSL